MAKKFTDLLKLIIPLNNKQKTVLNILTDYLEKEDLDEIKDLLKLKKITFSETKLGLSPQLLKENLFFTFVSNTTEEKIIKYVDKINYVILEKIKLNYFKKFSKLAHNLIPKYIGMNLYGFETIKKAVALQLFAIEPVHILLLGDPGTGKTEILRSASSLHPISSFGLGSGTSGAGLSITVKGKEVNKGLLPMADRGICAIDELNLMEQKDRASLYNAMEKGFVTYDKGGKHFQLDANVRVLATANPKGDKFNGWMIETIKKQLPFESALLSRFHIVSLVRKPNIENFMKITKNIIKGSHKKKVGNDEKFIQNYVSYAENINVKISKSLEKEISEYIGSLKQKEDKFIVEISPRLVIGFIRFAKASARMRLSDEVKNEDILFVKEIYND
ncbi:MAG: AAA family ATPase, partial [Nanoarchaeota archaeon]